MDKYRVLSIITTILTLGLIVTCSILLMGNSQKDLQIKELMANNTRDLETAAVLGQRDLVFAMLRETENTGGVLAMTIGNNTYEYVLVDSPIFNKLLGR